MKNFNKIIRFFDKSEDSIRARLSHRPILYACIGGVGIVLFWKGVWETAEHWPQLFGLPSVLIGLMLLLPTGLFVSFFIGDNIILSGYKREKKITEQTEIELSEEKNRIDEIALRIGHIENSLKNIERYIATTQTNFK